MKRFDLIFAIIKVPVDIIAIAGAAFVAYAIRYSEFFLRFRPATVTIPFNDYVRAVLLIMPIWIFFFAINGLYSFRRQALLDKIPKIFTASAAGFFAVLAVLIFTQEFFASRFIILTAWVFSVTFVILGRIIINTIEHKFKKIGWWTQGVVIVGQGEDLENVVKELKQNTFLGLRVVQTFPTLDELVKSKIINLKQSGQINELILLNIDMAKLDPAILFELSVPHGLKVSYSTIGPWNILPNVQIDTFAGVPFFNIRKTRLDGWGRILKRMADIVAAIGIFIFLLPLLLVIGLVVVLTSGRPIIYRNIRVGEDGEQFGVLKFRTMKQEYCIGDGFDNQTAALAFEEKLIAEQSKPGPVYKIKNDPRVTPIGKFLRRWSLDELPQLWNVIRGDMSLVGPRPHQPREVAKYEPFHQKLFVVKPGITGLAQISGRSDLSFDEEARLDSYYIDHWSPQLDLYILLKTIVAVISRKGAV